MLVSDLSDIVVGSAAFIGMLLGVYNFFKERAKDKVRLKIVPKTIMMSGDGSLIMSRNEFDASNSSELYALDIVNLSNFEVTVDEVGFLYKNTKTRSGSPNPIIKDDKSWPRKLSVRESVTVYLEVDEILKLKNRAKISYVFAATSCDNMCKGTSKSLKDLVKYDA